MNYTFKKAKNSEISQIWKILQQAIKRRKEDGSNQWQDGYPNLEVIKKDIVNGIGYVLSEEETIVGYSAVLINDEPAYDGIDGKWLTNDDFVVFHRVAISDSHLGIGLAKKMMQFIDEFALKNKIYSIKADTNFDNMAMRHIFEKSGLKIYDVEELSTHGGSLRVFGCHLDSIRNTSVRVTNILDIEKWLRRVLFLTFVNFYKKQRSKSFYEFDENYHEDEDHHGDGDHHGGDYYEDEEHHQEGHHHEDADYLEDGDQHGDGNYHEDEEHHQEGDHHEDEEYHEDGDQHGDEEYHEDEEQYEEEDDAGGDDDSY